MTRMTYMPICYLVFIFTSNVWFTILLHVSLYPRITNKTPNPYPINQQDMAHTDPLPLQVALDTGLIPAREEFQEALCLLTHIHQDDPQRLKKIITCLYAFVVHREPTFLQVHEPLRTTLIHLYKIPQKRPGTLAFYKRVVAKIYCYSGSSYGRLQTYCKQYKLKFKTNECEFRSTLLTVISEGYRSIQKRVVQNFAVLDIKLLDERQVNDIEPILYHLESNISKPGADLFRREIKNLFILEKPQQIDLTLCYQFYHELREKMEARQADLCPEARMLLLQAERPKDKDTFEPDPALLDYQYDLTPYKEIPKHHHIRQDDPDVWTTLVKHEMVAMFLQHRDISKVRLQLIGKYGEHAKLTCVKRLKCNLIKIIRGSVRLLQAFYRRQEEGMPVLPKMMELEEDKVKLLIGSPFEIKACLLEFYRQTTMSYRTLCEMVTQINVFLREKSLIRYQKTTASKAIIFSL